MGVAMAAFDLERGQAWGHYRRGFAGSELYRIIDLLRLLWRGKTEMKLTEDMVRHLGGPVIKSLYGQRATGDGIEFPHRRSYRNSQNF